jgi:eukaryotic-like serine/threonine-protein kinase
MAMDADMWGRLSRALDQMLDLPHDERLRWLSALGPEDEALKARLLSVLDSASSSRGSGPLDTIPTLDVEALEPLEEPADRAGAAVGPYRLVRELGTGGMGTVWLAERTDGMLRRAVALKLPRGAGPRSALVERLARERDILAGLAHAHIARLYDAGVTAEGRPYLALEYVEGQPIDAYCDRHRLGAHERLRVFLQVVDAVAYAHAKLVVHRDLKPSNILVTADGQVRLLDFGIAKLLEEGRTRQTELTEIAGRPHTPAYASPEQITGDPLSTASDVYSLGVVLYELLTGTRPYTLARDSRRALEDAILEGNIPLPGAVAADPAVRRVLRGDLDTVVVKALRTRPDDRYPTVSAFGDDLRRWLDGRPVLARPDSPLYRLRRFVGRNRVATAAAAVTVSAILSGAGVSVWQAREARIQRNAAVREKVRADEEAASARQAARIALANADLTDYLTEDLANMRSTTDLELQLERALAVVRQQHRDDPVVQSNLLVGIAGRFRQLGNFARHRDLVRELETMAAETGNEDARAQLACWRARDRSQGGNASDARALMDEVLVALRGRTPVPTATLTSCLSDDSAIARLAGDSPRAIAAIEEARRLEEEAGQVRTVNHADTLFLLSRAYAQAGRYREADEVAARTAQLRADIGREDSPGMTNVRIIHATILREGGKPNLALPMLEGEMTTHAVRGGSPGSIPTIEYETALTLIRGGRPAEALPLLSQAHDAGRARGDTTLIRATTIARVLALADLGRLDEAGTWLAQAETLYARMRADGQYAARLVLFAQAHVALAAGDHESARDAIEEARALLAGLPNARDPAWRFVHFYDAQLAVQQGHGEDARRLADTALQLSREQAIDPEASIFVGEGLAVRAYARRLMHDTAGSSQDARSAVAHFAAAGIGEPGWATRARALAF